MSKSEFTKQIERAIESLLENGATNRQQIYDTITQSLGVPRPIAQRIARNIRIKLEKRLAVLQSGFG